MAFVGTVSTTCALAGSVPHPLFFRVSAKQEELEEQEQEDTRRTCKTQVNDIYPDHETHCGGRRCALVPPAPSHPPFFWPFHFCFDNQAKQAEPQPQPLSQQRQGTCRGIVLTFSPLRKNNTNIRRKKHRTTRRT